MALVSTYILTDYGRDAIKGLILSLFIYSECRVLGQVGPFLVPEIKWINYIRQCYFTGYMRVNNILG